MKDIAFPDSLANADQQFEIFDDFHWYVSAHLWTNLAADGGVTGFAQSDAQGGVITGATGATDNNEIMCRSTNEVFKFAADRSFIFEARIQFAEANTDDANVAVGLADAAGANLIADNGASVGINASGALIYKVDGGTVWRCNSENNGTAYDSVSTTTAGGSSYQTLRIVGKPEDGTNYKITYFCDGQPLRDSNQKPITHTLAYASATEMRLVAGYLKAGDTNSETLNIDRVAFVARRA